MQTTNEFRHCLSLLFPFLRAGVPVGVLILVAAALVVRLEAQDWTPVHIVGMPYVAEARDARIQGVVRIKCALNSDGSVAGVDVLSGHKAFLAAVLLNARQWRFVAGGTRNASAAAALLIYEFRLSDPVCEGRYKEEFVFDCPDRVRVTSEFPCWQPDSEIGERPRNIAAIANRQSEKCSASTAEPAAFDVPLFTPGQFMETTIPTKSRISTAR